MAKKASKSKKRVAKRSPTRVVIDAASERVIAIPEIAVFSELPFARIGTIGGKEPPQPRSDVKSQPATKAAKQNTTRVVVSKTSRDGKQPKAAGAPARRKKAK